MKSAEWTFESFSKRPILNKPVLIEGLPGIGNVGKIVVDFMIDELKAVKLYEISGHAMPNSVFVNDKNLVELPKIEMFYKKLKNNVDLLLLTGDVQPIDEESCYEFCENLVDLSKKYKVSEIITLGGIGLGEVPKKPRVFCTGNSIELIKKYKELTGVNTKVYGVVGPIVGVSGLLIGIAEKKDIKAVTLLAETLGHPMYLGIKGAKETLSVLDKRFNLKLNTKKLEKEIAALDREMKKTEEISSSSSSKKDKAHRVAYIG
jgi:uncharacterized protein